MRRPHPLLALPLAVALLAAGCSMGGDPDGSSGGGAGADGADGESSEQAADPLEAEDADPDECTGDSVFIEAVEIPGTTSDPVTIPEVENEAGEVVQEEQEIPGVEIPDQRVPAQCATVEEAPAGCLGEAVIPPTALPEVTIPETTIPAFEYGDVALEEEVAEAVTAEGVETEGAKADEVCQISEEEAGEGGLIGSVLRPSVLRSSILRSSVLRSSIMRPSARLEDGTQIPSVQVPSVKVDAVKVDAVKIDADRLDARRVGEFDVLEGEGDIAFNIDADVLFETDSDEVRPDAEETLADLADQIDRELPSDAPIRVDGHTDADGGEDHNQDLSERRAQSVVDWLVDEEGLDEGRFTVTGYGETKPVASNDDDEGKQKNRRVVISAEV
ncbi:OmpA family protein [Nocardiopsis sp. RSe5-2]|uniref:OmpA family protein n=1 Tax=Nocardiopsis endophytica TaxID=3018445 RepID=A0ABT4UBN8_9ACTN|nr:OmpA family protein [Nocardiopsis endophytica]MDA2814409.1 OmpA family protein [Nocardiopsis endophytica]